MKSPSLGLPFGLQITVYQKGFRQCPPLRLVQRMKVRQPIAVSYLTATF
ncbi:MAG: hypothetical protein MRECE_1c122 [Mycoplasmataceae bacterium CE_OT135]|nr:MAG: hypothetical protein MRECE_1c045 [Mycoplasmataceae bacterium CE_OT135]KLL04354.1 MAG: hypothetical protein MRECE_1c122 [Mycoplasmataceae bacterium CE_OT135]